MKVSGILLIIIHLPSYNVQRNFDTINIWTAICLFISMWVYVHSLSPGLKYIFSVLSLCTLWLSVSFLVLQFFICATISTVVSEGVWLLIVYLSYCIVLTCCCLSHLHKYYYPSFKSYHIFCHLLTYNKIGLILFPSYLARSCTQQSPVLYSYCLFFRVACPYVSAALAVWCWSVLTCWSCSLLQFIISFIVCVQCNCIYIAV